MKIIHAADLHIGDSRNLPQYLDRQRRMLYCLTELAVEHAVDAFVIAGDIFDSKHVLPRERDMFDEWLFDNDRKVTTLIINGNHDELESEYTHLFGARRLVDRGVLKRTTIVDVHARIIELVPDLWIAALPAAGYKGEELSKTVATLRRTLDTKLEQRNKRAKHFVVVCHEAIAGAYNESGTYRARGPGIDSSLPVTYWALGDIHKPYQQMAPNAWYPGSPIQHEFGDSATERGCLLVDLDDPTNPRPLRVTGVVPLVTLYDRPDEWPTDAIVRYEGTAEEIADTQFPDNVVAFKPIVAVEDRARSTVAIDLSGYQILDGLDDLMVEQGVPPDMRDPIGVILRRAVDVCR